MSETIPSGWYPDPSEEGQSTHRERWWNGTAWTAHTRPGGERAGEAEAVDESEPDAPSDAVPDKEAEPAADDEPALPALAATGPVPPPPPPYAHGYYGEPYPARPNWIQRNATLVATAAIALLVGGGLGAGITYAAVGGGSSSAPVSSGPQFGGGGSGGNGDNGGSGGSGGSGSGGGSGGGPGSNTAVDMADGISLPIPSGWQGGTDTSSGHAGMTYGSYSCPQSKYGCSLGGVNTDQITGSTDPEAAAEQDIAGAAKQAYGTLVSHTQQEAKPVTVAGRAGYLIRWRVHPTQGNDGYVETVVFPTSTGQSLASVHFGFDIAPKAPGPSLMDTITSGIHDVSTSGSTGGGA